VNVATAATLPPVTCTEAIVAGIALGVALGLAIIALATVATLAVRLTVWSARRIVATADRHG
jgi:hypothetical protein